MNANLQQAAKELLEYLLWFADEEWTPDEGVPICDFGGSPGPEVRHLQGFYPPHRRLPGRGQELWRELQGMIDLDFTRKTEPSSQPDEIVRFHQILDRFIAWVVDQYSLAETVPEEAVPVTPRATRRDKPAGKARIELLRITLWQRHVDEEGGSQFEAYKLEELEQLLKIPQPTLSRYMDELFPEGGQKHYVVLCRQRNIATYFKRKFGLECPE